MCSERQQRNPTYFFALSPISTSGELASPESAAPNSSPKIVAGQRGNRRNRPVRAARPGCRLSLNGGANRKRNGVVRKDKMRFSRSQRGGHSDDRCAIWAWVKFAGEVWFANGFVLFWVATFVGIILESRGHKHAAEQVGVAFHLYCLLPVLPILLLLGLGWCLLQMPRWIAAGYQRALRFMGF
jgi:hypothetical protein